MRFLKYQVELTDEPNEYIQPQSNRSGLRC